VVTGDRGVLALKRIARFAAWHALFAALLLAGASTPLQAQTGWTIEPGQGWGPVRIGMTQDEVVASLGQPLRTVLAQTPILVADVPGARLSFYRQGTGSVYLLEDIYVSDRTSATREGIRNGSTLHDVVRAYGDTLRANRVGTRFLLCVTTSHFSTDPGTLSLSMSVWYRNRGISFSFTFLEGVATVPLVDAISVSGPRPCFDLQGPSGGLSFISGVG
jgi:hypothetical protein